MLVCPFVMRGSCFPPERPQKEETQDDESKELETLVGQYQSSRVEGAAGSIKAESVVKDAEFKVPSLPREISVNYTEDEREVVYSTIRLIVDQNNVRVRESVWTV